MADDPDYRAMMAAQADQMDARLEHYRSEVFRDYIEGPSPDELENEPLRLWREQDVWCAVLEGPIGFLCGYARLPEPHPWIGLHYNDEIPEPVGIDLEQPAEQAFDDHGTLPMFVALLGGEDGVERYQRSLAAALPVHGGLTFTGPIRIAGAPHGWWLGFDCGHGGSDAIDEERYRKRYPEMPDWIVDLRRGHVWTEEEVALEVKRMVPPILAARKAKSRRESEHG